VTGERLRVLSWNLYHGRDGAPGAGRTWRTTLTRRPRFVGRYVHVNAKLTGAMARVIAAAAANVVALQEVPPGALPELARITGMEVLHTRTSPYIGPVRLRAWLGRRNPDLWMSHEGNSNALLVGNGYAIVPGSPASVRQSPPRALLEDQRLLQLTPRTLAHWAAERRRALFARVRSPGGRALSVACVHLEGGDPEITNLELRRAAAFVLGRVPAGEPLVFAGDLNARRSSHDAIGWLLAQGLEEPPCAAGLDGGHGIDHIFHRGLDVIAAPRPWHPSRRELRAVVDGREGVVRLSDHDVVEAVYELGGEPGTT
jgi:hypothetical protein